MPNSLEMMMGCIYLCNDDGDDDVDGVVLVGAVEETATAMKMQSEEKIYLNSSNIYPYI